MVEENNPLDGEKKADTLKDNGPGNMEKYDLDLILDIPLDVSVELGKVRMPVNELLRLGQGSIIELAKQTGDPLDIYVNDKLIAMGEVVILDEKFGIRVTNIVNPAERIKSLG